MAQPTKIRPSTKRNIPVSDAAARLDMSTSTLRNYCRMGLVGRKVDDFNRELWLLSEKDIEEIRQGDILPAMGRPRNAG